MESRKESNQNKENSCSNLTVSNVDLYRPCSSSSNREYGPYREADTESVISKKTYTTVDNQDSDGENRDNNEVVDEKIDSDFDEYEEPESYEREKNLNTDESSSDSTENESQETGMTIANQPQTLITDSEPIIQSPFSRLTRTVRSYLNAANSYSIIPNPPENIENSLSNTEINTTQSNDKKIDDKRPKFEAKCNLFQKILNETNEFFENKKIDNYDLKSIYKLKSLFLNHENYYASMLISISDNFKLDVTNRSGKICNKRMKHSFNEDSRYDDEDDDEDKRDLINSIFNYATESNSNDDSNSKTCKKKQSDFHLCSLCSHCLCEPITLICGCSYCKNCLNEYNSAMERLSGLKAQKFQNSQNCLDDLIDLELGSMTTSTSYKRKHNTMSSSLINLYKCYNCSFVHENNTSNYLRQNVLVSKLVDKFWINNIEIRKLRNDLRKYVCFLIDTDLDGFSLNKLEYMFLKAYELDPSNHLIFADLFLLNYFDNCNPNCLKYAQSACELRPNWPFAFFMKCVYYLATGDLNTLKTNLNLCINLDPDLEQLKIKLKQLQSSLDSTCKNYPYQTESNDSLVDNKSQNSYNLYSFGKDSTQDTSIPKSSNTTQNNMDKQSVLNFDTSKYVIVNSYLVKPIELECSLCYRLLYRPVTTTCGHSFCCSCLDRSLDHQDKCPLCKHTLADYLAERRQNVTSFIDNLIQKFYTHEHEDRKKQYYEDIKELLGDENEIPVFVCTLGMPNIPCPLHIFEPRYKLMLRRAMESGSKQFGMCMYTEKNPHHFTEYGCMLEIKTCQFIRDGRAVVSTVGGKRYKVLSSSTKDGYNVARVEWVLDVRVESEAEKRELNQLHDDVYRIAQTWFNFIPETQKNRILDIYNISELPAPEQDIQTDNGPAWHWILLNILPIDNNFQYKFLTKTSLRERLLALKKILMMFLAPIRSLILNPVNTQTSEMTQSGISQSSQSIAGSDAGTDNAAGSDNISHNGTENLDSNESNTLSTNPSQGDL